LSKASDVGALIDRAHALLNGGPTESTPNQGT
jgi:hypothetical protein